MSYAFFCRHRPFWILIPDTRKRDTCSTTHENMELMIKAMKGCKTIDVNSSSDIVKIMFCDGHLKENCIKRQCDMCKDKKNTINIYEGSDMVSCERWINKKVPVKIKNITRLCQKTLKETFKISKANLSRMFVVDNIASKIKTTLGENEAFLHIDFAENYNCKYTKEEPSAHFGGSKPQISMHTAVLYVKSSNQTSAIECFCSVSENLRHDPVLICAHLKPFFEEIKCKVPSLQTMHFQCDAKNWTLNILWHLSDVGHGKGAPDGVGGCLKRTADASVATGNYIPNFDAFVSCLQEKCKGIRIFPIDDTHVNYIYCKRYFMIIVKAKKKHQMKI
ncbi:hypothetical protein ABMA28_003182 [Loxostege sticticalis]|uniref:Uncharacterized protein n=1 Tax=Loxostege sticticalis TaxID=481309 RepID=A0ABD0SWD9_LOXSC